jgi:hypothetical protein
MSTFAMAEDGDFEDDDDDEDNDGCSYFQCRWERQYSLLLLGHYLNHHYLDLADYLPSHIF